MTCEGARVDISAYHVAVSTILQRTAWTEECHLIRQGLDWGVPYLHSANRSVEFLIDLTNENKIERSQTPDTARNLENRLRKRQLDYIFVNIK